MRILLQPGCSLALWLRCEAATDHFGIFSGLDSMLVQCFGNQGRLDTRSLHIS